MQFDLILRQSSGPQQPGLQSALRWRRQWLQQIRHVVVNAFQVLRGKCGGGRPVHLIDPLETPRDEIGFGLLLDCQVAAPRVRPWRNVDRLADHAVEMGLIYRGGAEVRQFRRRCNTGSHCDQHRNDSDPDGSSVHDPHLSIRHFSMAEGRHGLRALCASAFRLLLTAAQEMPRLCCVARALRVFQDVISHVSPYNTGRASATQGKERRRAACACCRSRSARSTYNRYSSRSA